MPSAEPTLSVVVPATDDPPTLDRCLDAIRAGLRRPEELVVVAEPPGAGPAAARNEGAARATGEVLVFVDSDVVVAPDALARIAAAFERDPGLTALFGSYDDRPEAPGPVSGFRNLLHHHVHHAAAGVAETFWAGLGAIRREAFLAAGGFDAERYPEPSIEDIELGMRLLDGGGRIELDPAIQGTHLKRWSLTEGVRTDFARRGVPWVELLVASGGSTTALNLGWRHRLSTGASVALVGALARRRPFRAAAAAGILVTINRDLYALVMRRRGTAQAAIGIGVHVLHHLTAAAALVVGLARSANARSLPERRGGHALMLTASDAEGSGDAR